MANVREIITQQFIDALAKDKIPWRRPWSLGIPQNVEGRPYSGVNRFLLSFLPYKDPRYVTMKHANALGGKVKKGEHGHLVVYYGPGGKRQVANADGTTTEKQNRILLYYRVFNVEQCEGMKIKELETHTIDSKQVAEEIDACYIDKPEVRYGGERAAYSPVLDIIYMPDRDTFVSTEEFYSTKWHEFGHSTKHVNRLNRKHESDHPDVAKEMYSREELVAEMTAAFLLAEAGMDSPEVMGNAQAYIQGWAKKLNSDPSMVTWAAAKAAQAADYILGKHRASQDVQEAASEEDLVAA
jgi:antirestriction protein ArdC